MSSVDETLPLLEKVQLFEGLPREDLERIADICLEREAEGGELLFEEGEKGDAFYAVLSGAIEIFRRRSDGSEERLAIRRAGDSFGEMALLDGAPRSASARVRDPAKLVVLNRDAFRDLLDPESPAFHMLGSLSRALRALDIRFTAGMRKGGHGDGVRELNRLLRQGLLPRVVPAVDGYQVAGGSPVLEDGDGATAWDVFPLGEGHAFAVLRVIGNELPAAHLLGTVRGVLRALALHSADPGELLAGANRVATETAVDGVEQHVECAIGATTSGGTLRWACAGHLVGAVVRRSGEVEELGSSGPPLGMMGSARFEARAMELGDGDAAVLLSERGGGLAKGAGDLIHRLADRPAAEVVSTLHQALERALTEGAEPSIAFLRRTG